MFDRAVARVVIGSDGRATVDPKFVSGLPPSGPDSAVFTADGRMLISNLSAGTVSVVDPTSGRVITPQLNSMPIDTLADLAVDPSGEVVWGISHSGSGPMAIDRIALNGGQVTPSNPSGVEALGGIAFSESGRLFVSSQTGMIAELSPSDGHLLQSVHVDGAPDGMTVDPQTGHLFASGCNGLCEVDVGDSPGAPMRLVRVHGAANGDGIAADGKGHIVIASDQCCLVQLTIAIDQVVTVADSIPSADDVAPVVGAGAPTAANCAALASCFGSDTGAGLGAVGVAVVLALGTTGLLRRLPDPPLGAAAPHDAPQPAATGQAQPAAGAGHEQTAAATGHEQTAAATGHEQAAAATRHEHHAAGSPRVRQRAVARSPRRPATSSSRRWAASATPIMLRSPGPSWPSPARPPRRPRPSSTSGLRRPRPTSTRRTRSPPRTPTRPGLNGLPPRRLRGGRGAASQSSAAGPVGRAPEDATATVVVFQPGEGHPARPVGVEGQLDRGRGITR